MGSFSPANPTGFISGDNLLANVTRHESGATASRYRQYLARMRPSKEYRHWPGRDDSGPWVNGRRIRRTCLCSQGSDDEEFRSVWTLSIALASGIVAGVAQQRAPDIDLTAASQPVELSDEPVATELGGGISSHQQDTPPVAIRLLRIDRLRVKPASPSPMTSRSRTLRRATCAFRSASISVTQERRERVLSFP